MNRGALFAAIGAAALGVALLMVYKKRFETATSGGARVPVLVANSEIPFGEYLTRDMVSLRELPAAYLEERHIRASDAKRVIGVRVSRSIRANESILWSDLAVASEGGRTLSDMVRPGMRAISVPATQTSAFEGLLRPGDRVDVFLTVTGRDTPHVSVPLLQNLLVLAVGKDVGTELQIPGEDERAPSWRQRLTTVTVAVTPKQAKQLALAQDQGILQFALRNSDDVEVIDGLVETTREDLLDPLRRKAVQDSKRDRVRSVGATKGLTQLD